MKKIQFISISGIIGGTIYDDVNHVDPNTLFVPYAIGLLHAYIINDEYIKENYYINEKYIFENKKFIEEYYNDIDYSCDIFCFSTYLWNQKRHLKIADEIKKRKPSAIIIFGGQNIEVSPTEYSINYLKNNNQVDILVHGQGEIVFLELLKNLDSLENVKNISYRKNEILKTNENIKIKNTDLKKEVSPYYPKFLFQHMKDYADENNKVLTYLLETNRGCPFECVFCEWGKALGNSLIKINDIDFIKQELKVIIKKMSESKFSKGIFIIDSNFGIIKRDIDILNEIVTNKKEYNINQIFFSKCDSKIVTKYSLEIEKIIQKENISSHKLLALQTSNLDTLKNIKRPHVNKKEMISIRKEKKNKNYNDNGIEFIFSLPGGYSYQKYLIDLDYLIDTNPYAFFQAYVCFSGINTEIRDPEYSKQWDIKNELFPIFDLYSNSESSFGIVSTNSFSREEFAQMFKMNLIWKILKNDKPFNIASNIIIYLHKNNILKFSEFIEKFYYFIINNNLYTYKKNRNIFKYIDLISQGYYTKNPNKKITRKFYAEFIIKDFSKYVNDIILFIKEITGSNDILNKKLLKILRITILLIKIKGKIKVESGGWEAYGMHGIYYIKKINIDLKRIMNFDVF